MTDFRLLDHSELNDLCQVVVMMLGHSLWQGMLVACLVWIALRVVSVHRANARYAVAVSGLAAIILFQFVTFSVLRYSTADWEAAQSVSATASADETASRADDSISTADRAQATSSFLRIDGTRRTSGAETVGDEKQPRIMLTITASWLTIASALLLRSFAAMLTVRRWIHTTEMSPSHREQLSKLEQLVVDISRQMKFRRVVRLVLCRDISSPSVFGIMKPVILLPPLMLTGVSVEQWRVILAHELAHIRRWDSAINVIQLVTESVLFFNPVIWWLNRQIRVEREACCDAAAAAVSGQRTFVARTILNVADNGIQDDRGAAESVEDVDEPQSKSSLPVSMIAFATSEFTALSERIHRLVRPEFAGAPRVSPRGMCATIISIAVFAVVMQQVTMIAVVATAQTLTPRERSDHLSQLSAARTGRPVPPARDGYEAVSRLVPVDITVKTQEGAAPSSTNFYCVITDGQTTMQGLVRDVLMPIHIARAGTARIEPVKRLPSGISAEFPAGKLWIAVLAPGYAPQWASRTLSGSEQLVTIPFLLKAGETALLEIQGESGEPVADAKVDASVLLPGSPAGETVIQRAEFSSDKEGLLRMPHYAGMTVRLDVKTEGFQPARKTFVFGKQSRQGWTLLRGQTTTLRIIDELTQRPIHNAQVHVIESDTDIYRTGREVHIGGQLRDGETWLRDAAGPAVATADAGGTALVKDLPNGQLSTLAVTAPDFGYAVLRPNIKANMSEVVVPLTKPIEVSGKIAGDLRRLINQHIGGPGGGPQLVYTNVSDFAFFRSSTAVRPDGTFVIRNIMPARLIFELGFARSEIVVTKSRSDLALRVGVPPDVSRSKHEAESPAQRTVTFRFKGTSKNAPVRGFVLVHGRGLERKVVSGNQVSAQVPVGRTVRLTMNELVGYLGREPAPFVVTAGQEALTVDVPLVPAGAIHGTVLRANGDIPKKLRVMLIPVRLPDGAWHRTNNSIGATNSGQNTYFHSAAIGGQYRLLAWNTDEDPDDLLVTHAFRIDESNPIVEMNLRFARQQPVAVKVTSDEGMPLIGVPVKLTYKWNTVYWDPSADVRTNDDGLIFIQPPGDSEETPDLVTIEVAPSSGFTGTVTRVTSRDPTTVIPVQPGIDRSGSVTDARTKQPIPNAKLFLIPADPDDTIYDGARQVETDVFGRFRLPGLEPTQYKCRVVAPFPYSGPRDVRFIVDANDPASFRLRMERSE